ncbi:hypothetical protein BFJ63_vAg16031 [Fusarium oxysporum f. sp. narcissi]|uniref:Uncharacterized protein n=1 Tax=Fusarium oxysporum f. sp. narcissi TaxID=451672 RepID=A0A4Q2VA76_FUSOX|nr:hypothetical protein BFJ63_vAg16031 [Fusarium oxysporum f. sp. narcissi]
MQGNNGPVYDDSVGDEYEVTEDNVGNDSDEGEDHVVNEGLDYLEEMKAVGIIEILGTPVPLIAPSSPLSPFLPPSPSSRIWSLMCSSPASWVGASLA